jgi:hypothetical protein
MHHINKINLLILLIILSSFFILTCGKSVEPVEETNDPPPAPVIDQAPPNNSTDQSINSILQWMCIDPDNDPLQYDIYFGTDNNPGVVVSNQSQNSYNPSNLSYNTKYYWKIVAKDDHSHTTSSPIWNFTTASESPLLSVSLTNLDFGTATPSLTFDISNNGGDTLDWSITKNQTWLTVTPFTGTTTNETDQITASVNRIGLLEGDYTGRITILSDGGNAVIDVIMSVISVQVNDPPVVSDIPNQTIAEGATFTTITLDNYVSDPDNSDAEMTWTYTGNSQLTVNITNRVATISTPNTNWNGTEAITFRATDPGTLWDEDAATFTVTAENDPPVVSNIPSQTIAEGQSFATINLDSYVSDVDNTDAELTWNITGNTDLSISIDKRVVTIHVPTPEWNGSETLTFRATDPGSLWDEDAATFTVSADNDPPVVGNIPNQTVSEGATFTTINLDSYVTDADHADDQLVWTYTGNTELSVDITNRIATITIPDINWNGAESITFRATDPGTLWDEDAATFTVTAENDAPDVTDIPNQTIAEGQSFTTILLDNFVSDIDNTDAEMTWSYSGNTELTVDITNREAIITAPSVNWNGSESITFRATDPGTLWDEDAATFTVSSDNDPPVVSGIPDQTIAEGASFTTISLDDYVSDLDHADNEMTWTFSGNTELSVDITSRIATITTPDLNWNGSESIIFKATDPGALNDEDTALFTVTAVNDIPTLVDSVTTVSISPVDRIGSNTTVISSTFTDVDEPAVGVFNIIFRIREPNNSTELTLVDSLQHGSGGLLIVDNGSGSYTASYTYDPIDAQTLGLYDLYFEVTDGGTPVVDDYLNNLDELEITETNNSPTVGTGATTVSPSQVARIGTGSTVISAPFTDIDQPGVGAFTVKFIVRADNNQETILVDSLTNGNGGLTITDLGSGNYNAEFTWDPVFNQKVSLYDLYFEVSDGPNTAIDGFDNNTDELDLIDTPPNQAPVVTDIPAQSIAEGSSFTTITLDDFVSDVDNTDAEMTWTFSGNTDLIVDITSRIATITTPDADWNGTETLTFRATDPGTLFDEDTASFIVTAVNDAPVVSDIPDQTINDGESFATISLDDFVSDVDNPDTDMSWTFSGNTELSVDITNRIATITAPSAEWNGAETITFRAEDLEPLADSNEAIFTVNIQNDPPVVTDIPAQSITEGSSFTTITLDDFVSDVDNTDPEMTWTFSGNTDLIVDITSRIATITTPDADWNGTETLTFRATDPGTLFDEDTASFTVTAENDAPVVSDIPAQTINDGESFTTITLDDFVSDVDNTDAEMTWTFSGNTELSVDITNRVATITTPSAEWNGAETLTFRATDPGTLFDEDTATFTVNIQNDPPVVTDIPAQSITEGSSFTTITLDDFVSDVDNTDAEMTWTFSGNTDLIVDITSRIATITTPDADWNGTETLTFRATDPGALFSEDTASFTVTGINDAPVVGDIPNQTIDEGNSFTTITLDDFVSDVDNPDTDMSWTFSGNTELSVDITNRIATITTPNADWNGAETITFKAEDLEPLADSNAALFTVNAQNDAPTLVDSVTSVSVSPVAAVGANTTVISAIFTDIDQPAVTVFNVTIKIREPDNSTELTLVNNLQHGSGGLTIVDNGSGSYTASFTYDPGDAQTTGLYDLFFEVTDGSTPAVDAYDNNLDELEIN